MLKDARGWCKNLQHLENERFLLVHVASRLSPRFTVIIFFLSLAVHRGSLWYASYIIPVIALVIDIVDNVAGAALPLPLPLR